jgi:hypothetical protein
MTPQPGDAAAGIATGGGADAVAWAGMTCGVGGAEAFEFVSRAARSAPAHAQTAENKALAVPNQAQPCSRTAMIGEAFNYCTSARPERHFARALAPTARSEN